MKAEQDEIMKLEAFDLSYFHGKFLFGDDGFQNVLIYQPTFNTLELKKGKGTDYVIGWKSKDLFESKILPFMVLSHLTRSCRTKQLHDQNCKRLHRL